VLTHTYEPVLVPSQDAVDAFLPRFETSNKMSLEHPVNMGFTAGPAHYTEFKVQQHRAMNNGLAVAAEVGRAFARHFGRDHGGAMVPYCCEDAQVVLVTLGSVAGTVREVVDELRRRGQAVGMLKLRILRPFPESDLLQALGQPRCVGVLEKDVSFGYQGAVFSDVAAALSGANAKPVMRNFVAGLGGRDISRDDVRAMFESMLSASDASSAPRLHFVGMGEAPHA
jgi:pyruvate ferredoxin oxidoreductase alpha subunit